MSKKKDKAPQEDPLQDATNTVEESQTDESQDTDNQPTEEQSKDDNAVGERDELRNKYLRLMAEFENYKKRTVRERVDLLNTAVAAPLRCLRKKYILTLAWSCRRRHKTKRGRVAASTNKAWSCRCRHKQDGTSLRHLPRRGRTDAVHQVLGTLLLQPRVLATKLASPQESVRCPSPLGVCRNGDRAHACQIKTRASRAEGRVLHLPRRGRCHAELRVPGRRGMCPSEVPVRARRAESRKEGRILFLPLVMGGWQRGSCACCGNERATPTTTVSTITTVRSVSKDL